MSYAKDGPYDGILNGKEAIMHSAPNAGGTERTKRNRPCDACRRRKTKCLTENDLICVLCKFHNQRCTYDEDPRPRKRNASHHEDASTLFQKPKRTKPTKPGTGVEEYDDLPGPSLLKRTLGLQNLHHSKYVGPNDATGIYVPTHDHAVQSHSENHRRSSGVTIRFVHPSHAFRIIPDATIPESGREKSITDGIEATVRPHGPELVKLYFRIIHPSFPVLHKDVFLEKYARSYVEFSPPLLAAVYLLACSYWTYSEILSPHPRPDVSRLLQLAFASLRTTLHRPKLSTIQAGLLLSQYQALDRPPWVIKEQEGLTAQLVNAAHQLGLHLDASEFDIPEWEIGLRRRLSWAVFMQDKWATLLQGLPSFVDQDDWDVPPLDEEDFPETTEDAREGSSEVERGRLVFTNMAGLTEILAQILRTLFSVRSRRTLYTTSDKIGLVLAWIKPLQLDLKEWFTSLPDTVKMDTAASMKLSSVGYLRLAYLAVETSVHKQIMKALFETDSPDPTLVHICRSAARERLVNAVDFVQRLQAQHLASFWYFASATCCAIILSYGQFLEVTASTSDEKTFLNSKLKELKWALKVNGEAGAGFMKQALADVEVPVRILPFSSMTSISEASPSSWTNASHSKVTPAHFSDQPTPQPEAGTASNQEGFAEQATDGTAAHLGQQEFDDLFGSDHMYMFDLQTQGGTLDFPDLNTTEWPH